MAEDGARLSAQGDSTVRVSSSVQLASDPSDPWIGSVIADAYRIERVLGEGGMGLLYQASHLRIDRAFAVKVIHQPLAQREDMRSRFEREARVMSRVRSDHVVDVIDVVTALGGRTCIITELLDGVDLEAYLAARADRLPYGDAVSLARQCLWGLSAAHALSVVHRDLKPSNLFLASDSSGRVTLKVLDFGVAKITGDAQLTRTGIVVGTPSYMAPEQARGASFADARSDIYAVGAVLYRMLTGRPPYEEEDATATLVRIMQESPARVSSFEKSVPPGLEAVIERAMARDPAQRFQRVEEFDRELAPFDLHRPLAPPDGSTSESHATAPITLNRQAKLTRPLAVVCGGTLSLAAGFAVSAALALFMGAGSPGAQLSSTQLLLVMLGAGTGLGVTGNAVKRALGATWRTGAGVQVQSTRFVHTLAVGAATLGWLELSALLARIFALHSMDRDSPLWAGVRVAVSCAAGAWVFLRRPASHGAARAAPHPAKRAGASHADRAP